MHCSAKLDLSADRGEAETVVACAVPGHAAYSTALRIIFHEVIDAR
jgi:hypothetical protein